MTFGAINTVVAADNQDITTVEFLSGRFYRERVACITNIASPSPRQESCQCFQCTPQTMLMISYCGQQN